MRVDELREVLRNYEKESLVEISVELYKRIPKKTKEEYEIDETVKNFDAKKSIAKRAPAPVQFNVLCDEVWDFVAKANMQYYFSKHPSRTKWRFMVKEYIKALMAVKGEDSEVAAIMLVRVYRALSYGCAHWIFNTENPFRSVGYKQAELLRVVIAKYFSNDMDNAKIRDMAALVLESFVDTDTIHLQLLLVLVECLKTPESKETAIAECKNYLATALGMGFAADRLFLSRVDDFRRDDITEKACGLCFHLRMALHEHKEAVSAYWKDVKAPNARRKELALYCLLDWLEMYDEADLWMREYEAAIKKGLKPREEYAECYQSLKDGNSFEAMQDSPFEEHDMFPWEG